MPHGATDSYPKYSTLTGARQSRWFLSLAIGELITSFLLLPSLEWPGEIDRPATHLAITSKPESDILASQGENPR